MQERLQKILARAGFGSRRKCEQLIAQGLVEVDGRIVQELGSKADARSQQIRCLGRPVRPPRPLVVALNKPRKVISSTRDQAGRKTVMHLLPPMRERVYPVGRLDYESQGLLLLTNDGELCNFLTHPRYQVQKVYRVVIEGRLDPAVQKRIERGVWLSDGRTGPARIRVRKALTDRTVLDISIREGLNREVRRSFAKFGLKVRKLERIQIGPLSLGSLPSGAARELNDREVAELRGCAKGGGRSET